MQVGGDPWRSLVLFVVQMCLLGQDHLVQVALGCWVQIPARLETLQALWAPVLVFEQFDGDQRSPFPQVG